MNNVNYFVVAEDAIKGQDGSITLVKIFNAMVTKEMPVKPKMSIAFGFVPPKKFKTRKTLKIKIEITDLNDQTITRFSSMITRDDNVEQPPRGLDYEVISFLSLDGNVEFVNYGVYKVKLFCEDEQLAETRFEVAEK